MTAWDRLAAQESGFARGRKLRSVREASQGRDKAEPPQNVAGRAPKRLDEPDRSEPKLPRNLVTAPGRHAITLNTMQASAIIRPDLGAVAWDIGSLPAAIMPPCEWGADEVPNHELRASVTISLQRRVQTVSDIGLPADAGAVVNFGTLIVAPQPMLGGLVRVRFRRPPPSPEVVDATWPDYFGEGRSSIFLPAAFQPGLHEISDRPDIVIGQHYISTPGDLAGIIQPGVPAIFNVTIGGPIGFQAIRIA